MAEDFNNINRPAGGSMPDPNRPRLKKVKRPIKRIVNPSNAAGVSAAMPPKAEPVYQPQAQQQTQSPADDFDLDAILDGGENLPALNNTQEVASDFQPQFIDESDITPPKVPLAEQFMVDNMFTKKSLVFRRIVCFYPRLCHCQVFLCAGNGCSRRSARRRNQSRSSERARPLRCCRKNAGLRAVHNESAATGTYGQRFL